MDITNLDGPLNVDLTLVPLTSDIIDFKVGLFTSRSRLGRGVQSVGSYALPGDTTSLRHPVRSGIYQAATPGGSSTRGPRLGRRIGGDRQFVRCPNGFEFGGRFAGRNFSNCGRRVFENPFEGVNSGVAGAVDAGAATTFASVAATALIAASLPVSVATVVPPAMVRTLPAARVAETENVPVVTVAAVVPESVTGMFHVRSPVAAGIRWLS